MVIAENFKGWNLPNALVTKIKPFLSNDEKILLAYKGVWRSHKLQSKEGDPSAKTQWGWPWLLVSHEHVFIVGAGWLTTDVRSLPIKEVRSVDIEQAMLRDRIKIVAPGINMEMEMWSADRAITTLIPNMITARKKELTPGLIPPPPENDKIDTPPFI